MSSSGETPAAMPDAWKETRLKRVCARSALYGANIESDRYVESGVRFIRTTDISKEGELLKSGVNVSEHDSRGYELADGDVLFSRSGTIGRTLVYSREVHGPCAYAGYLVRFVPAERLMSNFLFRFSQTDAFAAFLGHVAIHSTIANVNGEKFANMPIPLPPRAEQITIVRYLDHVDSRIQRLIAARERLIELLEEKQQAIIHRAVTRGLDPHVPMKPSGVEWLGDVPAHWEVVSLGRVSHSRCDGPFGSGLTSSHYAPNGVRVVRLQNIGAGRFVDDNEAYVSHEHYATLGDHDVLAGDVLIAGLGDDRRHVGRACVAPSHLGSAMVKADCFRYRLSDGVNPDFAALQLTATSRGLSALATGSTRQRVNLGSMSRRVLLLPPKPEQEWIVRSATSESARGDGLKTNTRRQIALLREYRTRLISDVVTGKLDVREAAAHLHDEPGANDPQLDDALEDAVTV